MARIFLIGLNHKTASVSLRERTAFLESDIPDALGTLRRKPHIREAFLFSTCNRTEVLYTSDDPDSVHSVKRFVADFKDIPLAEFEEALYVYTDDEAVTHFFRVAASLDSMIVGEPQILGQVKAAYRNAVAGKTSGVVLNRLLHKTFHIAKRVRKETGIGDNAVSISYAAVELAGKIFNDLSKKKVMLIGAGEMAELAVEHLISQNVEEIVVANRTFKSALALAEKFRGTAVKFEEMPLMLKQVDIVVSSTGSSDYILGSREVKKIMKTRKNRPLFFIDIALPRDIDPAVNRINNAYLYDIDDLQNIVSENIEQREKETVKAERLIEEAVVKFGKWMDNLDIVPTIVEIKEKIEDITEIEARKTLSAMNGLSEEEKEAVRRMAKAIAGRVIHDPIMFLKNTGAHRDDSFYLNAARQIFNLDPPEQNNNNPE